MMTTHSSTIESESPLAPFRRIDLLLVSTIGLVLLIGLCFIASAVRNTAGSGTAGFLARQFIFIGMGGALFVMLQRINYLTILRQAPLLYLIGLLMLCGVFATRPINGARSWYDLYFFKLQPSELMKPIIILTLAHYLMYRDSYKKLSGLIVPLVLTLIPMGLILKQPDLGTFLAFAPVLFVMLFAAGARIWHLALMVFCGLSGMVLMWFTLMKSYQKRRVLAWLYPEEYRLGEAWQLLRAETAIGSGGFWGKGWGQSSQSGLNLLPEKHTDFIFAVVCEEGGFITATLLLSLIVCAALSGLGIASRTREPAGRLIAVGCVTIFCSQVLINTGVALGLLPTTGLTLPFVSYGGSSILSSFICLGLLINIGSKQEVVLASEDFAE
jgi:rod shape determining protein RodA